MMVQSMQAAQRGPKACTTCAKAKARCIPRADGGDKCERCYRLDKECFSRQPAPPRLKRRPKRSRVAELEKRLNELSSHFVGQQPVAPTPGLQDKAPEPSFKAPEPLVKAPEKGDLLRLEHLFPSPKSSGWESSNDTLASSPDALRPADSAWPSPGDADVFLSQFHETFAHLLPFVVVPQHMTAAELRAERPMLWKGVMMAGCIFDGARQAKLGEEMLADMGKAAIADGVKTLDLLQGLELLLAWFHFALKSSQTTHLLFLARSICVNLNSLSYGSAGEDVKYGSLDHLRAYAGMYYLNTLIFTTNKRNDVLMKTTQLDAYCKILETTKEYPSDEYLVKLVRIQQLAQTIFLTMAFDPATPMAMSLPLPMVIESFQDQLATFRITLPAHLAGSPTLQCHISIAEVLLTDFAISDAHCDSSRLQLTDRLQLLWSCVRSVRAFFKVRFSASELDKPRFLTVIVSDVAFAFITGIKLLTLGVPGWNLEHVGRELALPETLSRQIEDLAEIIAKRQGGSLGSQESSLEDPLERLSRLLKTAQELVALQLSGVSAQDIAQAIVGEMNSATWQDLMNDEAARSG